MVQQTKTSLLSGVFQRRNFESFPETISGFNFSGIPSIICNKQKRPLHSSVGKCVNQHQPNPFLDLITDLGIIANFC